MFQVKKFSSVLASMINWVSSSTSKVTDFNKGSVTRTLLEAVAMELEELYYQLLVATEEAIEEAIYRTFNFPRNPSEKAVGLERFTRLIGTEVPITIDGGVLVGTDTEPAVVFESQSQVTIPALTGVATGGGTSSLIDTALDFVAEGIIVGSRVVNVTDNGETQESGVTSITTTTNSNDTLNFLPLTGSASFEDGGDTYKVIVPYADVPIRAFVAGIGGNIAAHSLTVLKSNIPNISGVDNASAFYNGAGEESDLHRKARFSLYIQSLARATQGALEYAARTVQQVVAAKAIDDVRPTVLVYDASEDDFADITQAMRNPGDAAVALFEYPTSNGDALYIGANEPFDYANLHLFTLGVAAAPADLVWQYYRSDGVWANLTATDGTTKLTESGTLSFTIPTDWVATTIDGKLRLWLRLYILADGTVYSTIPTGDYCSLPPGLGYVFLYCHDGSGELSDDLKASVESAVELYRGCGITVLVEAPNKVVPTVTAEIVVATNYDMAEMITKTKQALVNRLTSMVLGEDLYVADLYKLIMEINPKAIWNCHITVPTDDIVITNSEVLRADPDLITITAVQL